MKTKVIIGTKCALFTCVFFINFFLIQKLFMPRWDYPEFSDNISKSFETFYSLDRDSLSVVFLGSSHMTFGVSPMEIYIQDGISSYNLGSSRQNIALSYYLLEEVMKRQSPKVVVLDASVLFSDYSNDASWRYVLDEMPISRVKIDAAKEYAFLKENDYIHEMISVLMPLYKYHVRWENVNSNSIKNYYRSDYYSSGYFFNTGINSSGTSIEEMNDTADMLHNESIWSTVFNGKEYEYEDANYNLYEPTIRTDNIKTLLMMRDLCDENNCKLVLIKIPSIYNPIFYGGAWTEEKYGLVCSITQENGIDYIDLLYDQDLSINIHEDFVDGGQHLNHNGAKKVSQFISNYLKEYYMVESEPNKKIERNMYKYDYMNSIADLQMETNFERYLSKLCEIKDNHLICIVGKDNFGKELKDDEIDLLNELGLLKNNRDIVKNDVSYLAYIENGTVKYEAISNQMIDHATLYDDLPIYLLSKCYKAGMDSSITINNDEYCKKDRGINIVVLDADSKLVIDSVAFDTYKEEHVGKHKASHELFEEYVNYLEP